MNDEKRKKKIMFFVHWPGLYINVDWSCKRRGEYIERVYRLIVQKEDMVIVA